MNRNEAIKKFGIDNVKRLEDEKVVSYVSWIHRPYGEIKKNGGVLYKTSFCIDENDHTGDSDIRLNYFIDKKEYEKKAKALDLDYPVPFEEVKDLKMTREYHCQND